MENVTRIQKETTDDKIAFALEATGHYINNILLFLDSLGFSVRVFNPLATNLFRKSLFLRKTKTDKIDSKAIALMILTNHEGKFFSRIELMDDLKQCTRHRQRLGDRLSQEKVQFSRITEIMFPELASSVWSVNQKSVYELLKAYTSIKKIAKAHLSTLTTVLKTSSRVKYGQVKAAEIRELAKNSIGTASIGYLIELISIIETIEHFSKQIQIIDNEIKEIMLQLSSPILSIPGISFRLGSVILSETKNINYFTSPFKLLAFAGLDTSIYESGQFSGNGRMVKRGSKYLRWALLQTARLVSMRCSVFHEYLQKKLNEGKHYFVALSHVAKKLIRVIFQLLKTNTHFDLDKSL
ncbi:IS110 family transposase [Enterococcus faecalis]|uniref:IS110 family transposase n=1 Tax=Enterococcus faecalis TaxID=1351 RepID=UPI002FCD4CC6